MFFLHVFTTITSFALTGQFSSKGIKLHLIQSSREDGIITISRSSISHLDKHLRFIMLVTKVMTQRQHWEIN